MDQSECVKSAQNGQCHLHLERIDESKRHDDVCSVKGLGKVIVRQIGSQSSNFHTESHLADGVQSHPHQQFLHKENIFKLHAREKVGSSDIHGYS